MRLSRCRLRTDAFLLFGRESRGLDQGLIDRFADCCRRIPMREGARSLNLSNAVAIAAYEALPSGASRVGVDGDSSS
ncbi:MAG: tRNA (cytidine(34)-2'-O)-methyltransferase [Adlercreutzia equolifaciens]